MTHLESPSHETHATIFSCMLSSLGKEQEFRKATTYATPPITEEDMAECAASPTETGRENPCLLFTTASIAWLNLGPGVDSARRPTAKGNAFQNLQMAATFAIPTRAVCYGDATIKELNE